MNCLALLLQSGKATAVYVQSEDCDIVADVSKCGSSGLDDGKRKVVDGSAHVLSRLVAVGQANTVISPPRDTTWVADVTR